MNCVFNGLLNKSKIYKKNFIPAYPDDLGVSIGAAYLADNLYNKKKEKFIMKNITILDLSLLILRSRAN